MCIWFGFNPAVNFCHFSTLLILSVLQVRHQLHQSSIYFHSLISANIKQITAVVPEMIDLEYAWESIAGHVKFKN